MRALAGTWLVGFPCDDTRDPASGAHGALTRGLAGVPVHEKARGCRVPCFIFR